MSLGEPAVHLSELFRFPERLLFRILSLLSPESVASSYSAVKPGVRLDSNSGTQAVQLAPWVIIFLM